MRNRRASRAPGQRRIDALQFAFLRAVILGVPLREAADRYLGEGIDQRLVERELRWLRTELLAAARRAGAFGDVRALQLDVAQLPRRAVEAAGKGQPTLEVFRAEVDPHEDFYSEAELLALYRERYPVPPGDRRARHVARLRERQHRALATLERVLVQPPTRDDPPSSWLEPALAARIEAVGLRTLGQLADWIKLKGHRWYEVIPKVGVVAAARVVDWLQRNGEALGVVLGPKETLPRRVLALGWKAVPPAAGQFAPIEQLVVPDALDGSRGTNRVPGGSVLAATNDRQAIEAWIDARGAGNEHTRRAYRREAERLLLWAIFERRKALSSLNVEDAAAYRAFLRNPQPLDRWVGKRAAIRLSPEWRPFQGPLSARSAAFAHTVLASMFDWLVRRHYLAHNIFEALPRAKTVNAAAEADPDRLVAETSRWLTHGQWAVMRSVLPALGSDEIGLRMRLTIVLAYTTGLRLSELIDARIGRLECRVGEAHDDGAGEGAARSPERRVILKVLGKGGKVRQVPIVPQAEGLLNDYLATRGLPDWVDCQRRQRNGVRLIGRLRGKGEPEDALSAKSVYTLVKEAFDAARAQLLERGLDQDAAVFARASTHWLRHTFGRHAVAGGVKLNVLQAVLGHASLQTTTVYTSDDGAQAWDAVRGFTRKRV